MNSASFKASAAAAAACAGLAATGAFAAPPADLTDLVGVYAIRGQNELKQRGYAQVRSTTSGGVRASYWSKGSSCVEVSVGNSRFISLEPVDYEARCAKAPAKPPAP